MKDLFSNHAKQYAAFRPTYPQELYDFLYRNVKSFERAWDAGCGNGQVASVLSKRFTHVEATDISAKQIEQAQPTDNIHYRVCKAENVLLADSSVDLVTVGQALHWFDISGFFKEATRVAKPGAVVAAWGYNLLKVDDEIDRRVENFYFNVAGPFWDPERKLVDDSYRHIVFPFREIETPEFNMKVSWSLNDLKGYITTWSAIQKFITAKGFDPVPDMIESLRTLWGESKREVRFPVFMRAGVVEK